MTDHGANNSFIIILTVVNILIVFLNFAVSYYINILAYNKRKKEERLYQSNFDLYKFLIINKIDQFINPHKTIQDLLKTLVNERYSKEYNSDNFRKNLESQINRLYDIQEKYNVQNIYLIECYSRSMKEKFIPISEDFFDKATNLFSKLESIEGEKNSPTVFFNSYNLITSKFTNSIFELVKNHHPLA